ncbi:MAG: glycosyltransferase involved in cell wall biosynthesis [Psychroserpens sp.]|jgi:glycosyltransferase involved in cell wall biosynthesis
MKVALVENYGADFLNSRLRFGLYLRSQGCQVIAVIPDDGFATRIQEQGIEVRTVDKNIRKRTPLNVLRYFRSIYKIFTKEKFDVIHFYSLQPNLIGTPAAFLGGINKTFVNHITGLGMVFTSDSIKYKMLQFITVSGYKFNSKVCKAGLIFQNSQDQKQLALFERSVVICGSAVNEDKFNLNSILPEYLNELKNELNINDGTTILFVSRLLKQKGLQYLVEGLKKYNMLNSKKINLIIVGWPDPENPDSFNQEEIGVFSQIERIQYLGKRDDVNYLIQLADIAALPTFYREGTPRFLLEAMTMGKAILTTDMPGCDHLVGSDNNGIIISPRNSKSIIRALEQFENMNLIEMGKYSRKLYFEKFSEAVVYSSIFKFYSQILKQR